MILVISLVVDIQYFNKLFYNHGIGFRNCKEISFVVALIIDIQYDKMVSLINKKPIPLPLHPAHLPTCNIPSTLFPSLFLHLRQLL